MIIDIEKLIDAIEERPALYKKDLKEYVDIEVRNKCWGEVCNCVYKDWNDVSSRERAARVDEIKKKWKNLRTCFTKELRDQKAIKSGTYVHNKRRTYIYFDRLLFLQPTFQENETPVIIKVEGEEEHKEGEDEHNEGEEEHKEGEEEEKEVKKEQEDVTLLEEKDDDVTLFEEKKEEVSPVKKRKLKQTQRRQLILLKKAKLLQRRTNNLQNKMGALLKTNGLQIKKAPSEPKALENGVYEIKNSEEEIREMFSATSSASNVDEETHFALSIVPLLRKLNDDIKLEAQIEILNLLKKFNQKQRLYGFTY